MFQSVLQFRTGLEEAVPITVARCLLRTVRFRDLRVQ
jgi:hypothetical protein